MDRVIGFATRGISLGIATASEAVAGRKENKKRIEAQREIENGRDSQTELDDSDQDLAERAWELDEAGTEQTPPAYEVQDTETTPVSAEVVALSFIDNHRNAIDAPFEHKPLPQPVILPQRRPRERSRGFIRAYAPSLGECSGIDQNTFIDFINDFDKASKASPIFNVINIACFGIGLVPSTICMAVSTAVGTANAVAQELQTRYRTNKYLDNINESLFMPRGLYVMVMAYNPDEADQPILQADISDPTAISLVKSLSRTSNTNILSQKLSRFRLASGTVKHDIQMPEPAPLIYPALDQAYLLNTPNQTPQPQSQSQSLIPTQSTTSTKIKTKSPTTISTTTTIQTYLDHRSQTLFKTTNPTSKLSQTYGPQPKFTNRFCDPNHPVNSGSIFGLISGGTFDPIAAGRVRRAEYHAQRHGGVPLTESERHDAYMGRKVRGRSTGTPSREIPILGKMLKKGVLYLVVVNLPGDEEVRLMRRELGLDS